MSFTLPDAPELPARLNDVLSAVYAAYGAGWGDLGGGRGLTEEALFLGRLLVSLLPGEPETLGYVALMLFCESRRPTRRDGERHFVPLVQQDTNRWSHDMIMEAEQLLTRASGVKGYGRFQCEAAIQSVHAQRAITGRVHCPALRILYDLLLSRSPSLGVAVSRVAALIDSGEISLAREASTPFPRSMSKIISRIG